MREKKERERERENENHFLLCAGSDHVRESELRGEPIHEQEKMNEEGGSVGVCVCAPPLTGTSKKGTCAYVRACVYVRAYVCMCVRAHPLTSTAKKML